MSHFKSVSISAAIAAPFVSTCSATVSNCLGSKALHVLFCCSSSLRVLWCRGSYFWCVRSISRGPLFLDLRRKPPPLPSKPLPLLFSTGAAKIDETRLWSEVPESSHRMLLMIPELQTLFSVMEFVLPNSSDMEYSLYSSAMEFLLIGSRLTTRLWFQRLFIATSVSSRVARSVYGLEDWTTDDTLSVLFKGSAFRYQITATIVAAIRIVYPTLVVVSITCIGSLIVFIMLLGVIPLLRLHVAEIRGRLSNVCCLRIVIAFIFCFYVFRLTFVAANLLAVNGLLSTFVINSSFDGE